MADDATPLAPILEGLKDGSWSRIELRPLGGAAVRDLLADLTGATVEHRTATRLAWACGGLPAFLLALCRDGQDDGSLAVVDGLTRWRPDRHRPARLASLVAGRLSRCSSSVRDLVELLAFTGTLPLVVLDELGRRPDAAAAEAEGLIQGRRSADGVTVEVDLAVPAVGLVLRSRSSLVARSNRLVEVIAAWERVGTSTDQARARLAAWSVEAGSPAGSDELLTAARTALDHHDHVSAEALARAALPGSSPAVRAVLAEALEKQGRHADALAALGPAGASEDRLVRAGNIYWEGGDLLQAERELGDDQDTAERSAAAILRAWLLMAAGRSDEAAAVAHEVTEAIGPHHPDGTWATVVISLDLALRGRTVEALAMARPLVELSSGLTTYERSAPGLACAFTLLSAGRAADAVALSSEGSRRAAEGGVDLIVGAWHGLLGMALRSAGDLPAARSHLLQAVAALDDDPYRFSRLFVAETAATWAQQGDAARARSWWDRAGERDPSGVNRLFEPWVARLGAWVVAAEGDLVGAVDRAVMAADEAAELGQPLVEAIALHAVARFGRPGAVAARAAVLGRAEPTPAVRWRTDVVAADSRGDGGALLDLAAAAADRGAGVMAAETATAAAHSFQRQGDRGRLATALEVRAHLLTSSVGAATPGLLPPGRAPLTSREREVAFLAAGGATSADIASRLGLSRRTVDNHLGRVFDKLNVRRRHDLRLVLGLIPSGSAAPRPGAS